LKTVFFGSSSYVIPVIEALKKNYNLALVVTTEKSNGAVPFFCKQNNISFRSVTGLKDSNLKSLILNHKSQVAVVADFGLIIPEEILNSFPKGIINIHPSLLPKFRGPSPVQAAILEGVKTTGVSIMKIDNEIDHGPILGQEKEEVLDTDTGKSLYKRLFDKGAKLLIKVLNLYLNDNLKLSAQNYKEATFSQTLKREDGFIDISNPPSKEIIQRMVRAYFPWPGVWFKTKLNGTEKIVKLLPGQRIQVAGKNPMTYKDFLNGYPQAEEILRTISS
jgi:methionyl-tRNA formyltransferase